MKKKLRDMEEENERHKQLLKRKTEDVIKVGPSCVRDQSLQQIFTFFTLPLCLSLFQAQRKLRVPPSKERPLTAAARSKKDQKATAKVPATARPASGTPSRPLSAPAVHISLF